MPRCMIQAYYHKCLNTTCISSAASKQSSNCPKFTIPTDFPIISVFLILPEIWIYMYLNCRNSGNCRKIGNTVYQPLVTMLHHWLYTDAHIINTNFCQMMPFNWNKSSSITNIMDAYTQTLLRFLWFLPLKLKYVSLPPLLSELAYLCMLFLLQQACTASSAGAMQNNIVK